MSGLKAKIIPTSASADTNPLQGTVEVTNVEVGYKQLGGGWERTERVENNTSKGFFDVRIDVTGLDAPTTVVYLVTPLRPSDQAVMVSQSARVNVSSSSTSILHGDPVKHAFRTGIPGNEWDSGTYAVDVAVIDVSQPAVAGDRSYTFEIQ